MRTEAEIRAEIERWKRIVQNRPRSVDAAAAAIMVATLTWALGQTPSPATRVKLG
jgi:hypothetical protein